ncbi:hypothetical protein CDD83_8040 [Cordyceps sp. RAO-2017]|nr:hypothetical protein CDD83_8040 [Cordyceps sp. RAO-2017]
MHDAVKVTNHPGEKGATEDPNATDDPNATEGSNATENPVEVDYKSELITDYEKLAKSVDVSASASISGDGASGSVTAEFLDRSVFETSFLTYIVKVDVRRQPTGTRTYAFQWDPHADPVQAYGDRFISDFVKGGALFARVSIITKDKSHQTEVKQSAEASFNVFSAGTNVSESVKTDFKNIQKHSTVQIKIFYVGAPSKLREEFQDTDDGDLLALKGFADKFFQEAGKHDWNRYAVLEQYSNAPGYDNKFKPLDYAEAKDRSWSVFLDFSDYLAIQTVIRQNKSRQKPSNDDPSVLRGQVLVYKSRPRSFRLSTRADGSRWGQLAVKPTRYIGQRLGKTDLLDKELHHGAKELFAVDAFDFAKIPGTSNVIFARKTDTDQYECVMGRDVTPGYKRISELWAFEKPVQDVGNATVEVVAHPDGQSISLHLKKGSGASPERRTSRASNLVRRQGIGGFSFYVRAASNDGSEDCENCV